MIRRALFWLGLVLVLAIVNWQIVDRRTLAQSGTTMLVELRPADPRSLIQGDYMRLAYADPFPAGLDRKALTRTGTLVVGLDAKKVARFVRLDEGGALAPGQHRLRYRLEGKAGGVRLSSDSFLFQEGHADVYAAARYAVLKVAANGDALLVGLAEGAGRTLQPK